MKKGQKWPVTSNPDVLSGQIPALKHDDVLRRLEAMIARIGNQVTTAKVLGITTSYLTMVRKKQRQIGPVLAKALKLRVHRYVIYRYEDL